MIQSRDLLRNGAFFCQDMDNHNGPESLRVAVNGALLNDRSVLKGSISKARNDD